LYTAYYNHRAQHDVEKNADVWIVEELCQFTFFRMCKLFDYWSEHKEPDYDSDSVIRFKTPEEAFAYVERLLDGNPRGTHVKTVVTEVDHERIN
jgi:hypothetical protein